VENPRTIGKYTVIKMLGAGGFGAVYLAEDRKLNDKVAIKVFSVNAATRTQQCSAAETEASLRERFLREAQILRKLSVNAHIIGVYDFGEMSDGAPYFVMPKSHT